MSEWIPTKQQMPKEGSYVLTCNKDGWISTEMYIPATLHTWNSGFIVAWMELPKPYIEQ